MDAKELDALLKRQDGPFGRHVILTEKQWNVIMSHVTQLEEAVKDLTKQVDELMALQEQLQEKNQQLQSDLSSCNASLMGY